MSRGSTAVVYYSWSGNTRHVAGLIQARTGGVLKALEPEVPYPSSYEATLSLAKAEIREGKLPALAPMDLAIHAYDFIFLGSPNWWGTIAPPVAAFLSQYDLAGKIIAPFITHGGGGAQRTLDEIRKRCPRAQVLPALVVYGRGTGEEVEAWISTIRAE
ncbi:flavodoxin [Spirochaeta thermophila]|uniref:Putative flavodoxin n=1 Tax=Winmispira thermophila (strain ATCC 49972 / DSM 6192 / RI 19.B1) TaxID=665571 RepID=E0RSY4_WINT6|nr:flavodoxin [Spirochaeta thermophila]ADN02121.1 putative flavodoxin [Spirochaeta thermophila DSM 6192]